MVRAIALARGGLYTADPNPRVGCVIAHGREVIGEGWHVRTGQAHAEINALHDAGGRARGATAYVSQEPCCHTGRTGPCTEALIEAGIARVVAATIDPNPEVAGRGLARLQAAGIETRSGVMEEQAQALNRGFTMRMQQARPWVRIKMAMSLDGRTALSSGESRWITGREARHDVHRLRARSSAMLTGIGTLLSDDPALTPRLHDFGEVCEVEAPLKIVLDSTLRTPARRRPALPSGALPHRAPRGEPIPGGGARARGGGASSPAGPAGKHRSAEPPRRTWRARSQRADGGMRPDARGRPHGGEARRRARRVRRSPPAR